LKEPKEKLVKFLDVPAVYRGDLFYIQNLILTLQAPATNILPGDYNNDGHVDYRDFLWLLTQFGQNGFNIFNFNTLVKNYGK